MSISSAMKKQRSPGPAAYNIKSTVCSDAPAYSFGTMKRPAPNFKGISPGPVYLLKASLGRNRDQTFKAMPAFGFGTSERPDPGGNSKMHRAPGPGEYALGTAVGPVKPPIYKSASSFGFGTSSRLPGDAPVPKRLDRSTIEKLNSTPGSALTTDLFSQPAAMVKDAELTATPGPGHYDGEAWKKKRPPAYSFGTSAQRPSVSTRASRVPGPGKYKPAQTTGQSTSLTLRKGPAFGFGTAKLGGNLPASDVPGPGSYLIPSAFGVQPGAEHRSLPQFTFGTTPRDAGMEA